MAGSLSGQRLMSNLALTGAVDIREFAPREVLERFDVAVADGRRRRAHARERESEFALQLEPSRAARHAAQPRRLDADGPRRARRRAAHLRSHRRRHQRRPLPAAVGGSRCAGRGGVARRGRSAARRAAHARCARRAQVRPSEVQRPDADQRRFRAECRQRRRAPDAERATLWRPASPATFACRSKPIRRA